MSTHFIEKERAFIEALEADTGLGLDGWMASISGSGLEGRNEIIDWLRQKGFTFAKASWLERIHHNGGELIYAGANQRRADARARPVGDGPAKATDERKDAVRIALPARPAFQPLAPSPNLAASAPVPKPPPVPTAVRPAQRSPAPPAPASEPEIEALLLAAKAYRPLAQALFRDILAAVPGADTRVAGSCIAFELGGIFAAIAPGPKGVRLHLPDTGLLLTGWQRARSGPGPGLERCVLSGLLTDARQLDAPLMQAISRAAQTG